MLYDPLASKTGNLEIHMKAIFSRHIIAVCTIIFLTAGIFLAQPAAQLSYRVFIDPAHGGTDPGVAYSSRVMEKDITLAVGLVLKKHLEGADRRIHVQMARSADKTVSVDERVAALRAYKPDLVISLHVNAGFGPEASGFEISMPGHKSIGSADKKGIVQDMEQTKNTNESIRLAHLVQKNLEGVFPRKGRGIREVPVPLLEVLYAPSVCVELGFLTNKGDRDKLLAKDGQQEIAKALGRGVLEYLRL